MIRPSGWKVFCYLAAIFLAGGISGSFIKWPAHRYKAFAPISAARITDHMRSKFKSRLDLTPAQLHEFEPAIVKAAGEIEAVRNEMAGRILGILSNTDAQMVGKLNPEQQRKLAALEHERRNALSPAALPPGGGR